MLARGSGTSSEEASLPSAKPVAITLVDLDTGNTSVVELLQAAKAKRRSAPGGGGAGGSVQLRSAVRRSDVGRRVRVDGYDSPGKLVFYGAHAANGRARCGVELDDAVGRNNGTVGGHAYFQCEPKRGLLVKPDKVTFNLSSDLDI
jgi:hypothetical protein